MIVAGIDVGGENAHVVIMNNLKVISKAKAPIGIKKAQVVEQLYDKALEEADLKRGDMGRVVSTGSASGRVPFAEDRIPDAAADAKGVVTLVPSARTIVDVGAEEGRAIKVSHEGEVLDFAINEKCAAGTGIFIETMANALEISVEEMAKISLESTKIIHMNAQCAVFGESEVVGLIHAKVEKKDIARAVHDAIAERITSLARIVGIEKDFVMIGGVAKNQGFIDSLKRASKTGVIVPENPEYIGAMGAAITALGGIFYQRAEEKWAQQETIDEGMSQ